MKVPEDTFATFDAAEFEILTVTQQYQVGFKFKELAVRQIYHSPYILADIEKEIFKNDNILSRQEVLKELVPYIKQEVKNGTRLNNIMRHTLGLFHGQSGSSFWKRYLSENMCVRNADVQKIDHIMDNVKLAPQARSVGQID